MKGQVRKTPILPGRQHVIPGFNAKAFNPDMVTAPTMNFLDKIYVF